LRIIKRTKITIIRTETVFLKKQNGESAKEVLQIQTADLLESEKDSVLEIEAVKQIESKENKGDVK
jgi:hypothetical protein